MARSRELDDPLMPQTNVDLVCRDCARSFTFDAEERAVFASRGLVHPPSRCPACRAERKSRQEQTGRPLPAPRFRDRRDQITTTTTVCGACGKPAVVPFAVRSDRVAYCSPCFEERRGSGPQGTRR
jgi:CxxC-x17-CxxC domain-containing protein